MRKPKRLVHHAHIRRYKEVMRSRERSRDPQWNRRKRERFKAARDSDLPAQPRQVKTRHLCCHHAHIRHFKRIIKRRARSARIAALVRSGASIQPAPVQVWNKPCHFAHIRLFKQKLRNLGKWSVMQPELKKEYMARCNAKARAATAARRALKSPKTIKLPAIRQPSGSVLACSAPSMGRDLLARITALVPRCDDREEVIGEAVMLALEGASDQAAVKEAGKRVRRSAGALRYTKQIETCFFL